MVRAVTILTENFSDWEPALINSTGRAYYGFETCFASPGGMQVTSSGGMTIIPDLAIEAIRLEDVDLLIVPGGPIWKTDNAPAIEALVREAHARNIVVAGICDGTRVLAKAGVLDHLQHTSNSADNLKQVHYREQIITRTYRTPLPTRVWSRLLAARRSVSWRKFSTPWV